MRWRLRLPTVAGAFIAKGMRPYLYVAANQRGKDTMLSDLRAAFINVATLIKLDGIFAFSVEKSSQDAGFELRTSLRYAHSETHVATMLVANGMETLATEETIIRTDAGEPITGLLFLARRT